METRNRFIIVTTIFTCSIVAFLVINKEPDKKVFHVFQSISGSETQREIDRSKVFVESKLTKHRLFSTEDQRNFLVKEGSKCYPGANRVLERYDEMHNEYQLQHRTELWKYCALYIYGGCYLDFDSPLLFSFDDIFGNFDSDHSGNPFNTIIIGSFPKTIHGAAICLRSPKSVVAKGMLNKIMEVSDPKLLSDVLYLPTQLYLLIFEELGEIHTGVMNDWMILQQSCSGVGASEGIPLRCSTSFHLCCEILNSNEEVLLLTPHPLLPNYMLPNPNLLPKPYNYQNNPENLPYISIVTTQHFKKPSNAPITPNFFDLLMANDCLPSSEDCSLCLRNKQGANCETCIDECECYCKELCFLHPEPKFVSKILHITPPLYAKQPHRFIPRIVHQTWFEPVTKEKYPNMSRLIESWKRSGWEYRFYDDEAASLFLTEHFPSEVREAYDSITPGAFKADLFRYCILLVHGGVYSDMDVMLEANLDNAIPPDVGFMTPMDEPGTPVNHRMCLWNGFIASAPAHPFLASVLQHVVNNIRNRFTSVDIDQLLCPNPELSISHAFDTLFTAGPCILGLSINQLLKRHEQTQYTYGDLSIPPDLQLPGRSIILKQNKNDMGAHRFTWVEKNLVVAATDMPNYDDRKKLTTNVHYSETHVKTGIYGVDKLYTDDKNANELLHVVINSDHVTKMYNTLNSKS